MILTQEQEMIRDTMRSFAEERLAPFAGDWDRHHTFPAEALKELCFLLDKANAEFVAVRPKGAPTIHQYHARRNAGNPGPSRRTARSRSPRLPGSSSTCHSCGIRIRGCSRPSWHLAQRPIDQAGLIVDSLSVIAVHWIGRMA